MTQKFLFPVDFSPSCAGMAVYVKRAAAIFEVELTLVHVFDLSSHNGFELLARMPDASTYSGALGRTRDLTYSLILDSPCPVMSV